MLEHGAYGLLLDYYYAEERPIPLDMDEVYRMVRALLPEERRAVVKVLSKYFDKMEDGYHNARADEEISAASKVIETAKENGKLGGRPKKTNMETELKTEEITDLITDQESCDIPRNNHPTTDNRQPTEDNRQPTGNPTFPELLPTNIPYKEIVSLYNATMEKLPRVRTLSNERRRAIRAAWTESPKWQSLKFWQQYFEECQNDDFTNGTGPYRGEHANWTPDFDYLIRKKVVIRIWERALHRIEQEAA